MHPASPSASGQTVRVENSAIVTIFRSRLRPEALGEYEPHAARIEALARTMPGFVAFERFAAADGERVSIITFADQATHNAWRDHPEHRAVQKMGRDRFYATFDVSVTVLLHRSHFELAP
jgi:heme-degrading monooxygenase HmoA